MPQAELYSDIAGPEGTYIPGDDNSSESSSDADLGLEDIFTDEFRFLGLEACYVPVGRCGRPLSVLTEWEAGS